MRRSIDLLPSVHCALHLKRLLSRGSLAERPQKLKLKGEYGDITSRN